MKIDYNNLPVITWDKPDADESYYVGYFGRFELSPLYLGRTRPQGYTLTDRKTGRRVNTYLGLKWAKEKARVWLAEIP